MDCIGLIPSFHGYPNLNDIYMYLTRFGSDQTHTAGPLF